MKPDPVAQVGADLTGRGTASLSVRRAEDGAVTWVETASLSRRLLDDATYRSLVEAGDATQIALAFLEAHRELLRLASPREELSVSRVDEEADGKRHVRLAQRFKDVPLADSEMIVHVDGQGHVYLINGRYRVTPRSLSVEAKVQRADAKRYAAAAIEGIAPDCGRCATELEIYAPTGRPPRLAYRVDVSAGLAQAWVVHIDAESGDVLDKHSKIRTTGGSGPIPLEVK